MKDEATVETGVKKKPGRPPKQPVIQSMETEDEEDQEMIEAQVIFSNISTGTLHIYVLIKSFLISIVLEYVY